MHDHVAFQNGHHHHPVKPCYRVFKSPPKTAPTVRKVYDQQQNCSDNSDYGELRAIVRRIEMNQNESKSVVLENQSPADVQSSAAAANGTMKKKLVFDYVPTSVMMKR